MAAMMLILRMQTPIITIYQHQHHALQPFLSCHFDFTTSSPRLIKTESFYHSFVVLLFCCFFVFFCADFTSFVLWSKNQIMALWSLFLLTVLLRHNGDHQRHTYKCIVLLLHCNTIMGCIFWRTSNRSYVHRMF